MAQWHDTMDEISAIEKAVGNNLTTDQRIAIAQVHATLAIAQELSRLNPTE